MAHLHELRRDEDGQALVLGAVVMLVLALAVLGTAPIASAIQARIRLQNAADAAAYTLAAQEARAFNFYAYSNRAQVSQYVAAMQLVSTDAFILFVYSLVGFGKALVDTVGSFCTAGICGEVLCSLPLLGEVLQGLAAMKQAVDVAADLLRGVVDGIDTAVGRLLVPLIQAANRGLFLLDLTYKLAIEAQLSGDGDLAIARETAPDASSVSGLGEALRLANLAAFRAAHDGHSEELGKDIDPQITDGDDGARNRARRAMGELVQATRSGFFVYDRTFPQAVSSLLGLPGGATDALNVLTDVGLLGKSPGSTRLISLRQVGKPGKDEAPYDRMEKNGYGWASYPAGDALVANQYFGPGVLGPISMIPGIDKLLDSVVGLKGYASVVTTDGEDQAAGWHCAWTGEEGELDLNCLTVYWPKFSCTDEGGHPWEGITPFMSFASDASFASGQNQPDVWVALQAPRAGAVGRVGGSALDVSIETPSGQARARTADVGDRMVDGMVAVARATAYYHRPGNWHEAPNFWNPFWRAKLAPVEPGLERIPGHSVSSCLALPPAGR